MHAVFRAVRSAQRPVVLRSACRIIGGARYPLPRNFHHSAISRQAPAPAPPPTEGDKEESSAENTQPEEEDGKVEDGVEAPEKVEEAAQDKTTDTEVSIPKRNGKSAGRLVRGVSRTKQPDGVPPVVLPDWFWSNNVICIGGDASSRPGVPKPTPIDSGNVEYLLDAAITKEILTTFRAGLALNAPRNTGGKTTVRPISLLYCPQEESSPYLDYIVEQSATRLDADLVRVDAQDLALLLSSYLDENLAWQWTPHALLAYEAHKAAGKTEDFDKEVPDESVEEDAEEDEIERMSALTSKILGRVSSKSSKGKPRQTQGPSFLSGTGLIGYLKKDDDPFPQYGSAAPPTQAELWNDLKLTTLLDTLANAADAKRIKAQNLISPVATTDDLHTNIESKDDLEPVTVSDVSDTQDTDSVHSKVEDGGAVSPVSSEAPTANTEVPESPMESTISSENPPANVRNVIIQIRDYNEIMKTKIGPKVLSRLQSSVDKKWQDRTRIILVGTTTTNEEAEPIKTKPDIQYLQSDIVDGQKRTIFIPPMKADAEYDKDRIRRINIRHVEDMVLKLADGSPHLITSVNLEKDLGTEAESAGFGLDDSVWNYPRVHRTAIAILGLQDASTDIEGPAFLEILKLLATADDAKATSLSEQLQREDDSAEAAKLEGEDAEKRQAKEKLRELKKKCNTYEKKLLSGVVFPSDIRTTFGDIQAPKETIEALKTLTSLSLLRPDSFKYGVLSTDKIPGVLLYGPPGTGKTLLAKAVAKESGATVLEITAADLNDMFVGQGEKNVRAVFTLAKKLSPCVVFLDEADAIFSQRSPRNRNAHREMINQFLREWDGITTDLSAFIMLATNRPFDLDEAVLRRLPRRLLVDLPVEKDREAILQIHLKDEVLDPSVSLAKLAKDTPFYSGSDLKNVSVAAALACVRDENAAAAAHTGEEAYVYPEKRTLTETHFKKALEEISASISEDMSTLTAIRKFDEKYGDRKGRKKKGPGLGFGGTKLEEKDSEAAMVRKLEA